MAATRSASGSSRTQRGAMHHIVDTFIERRGRLHGFAPVPADRAVRISRPQLLAQHRRRPDGDGRRCRRRHPAALPGAAATGPGSCHHHGAANLNHVAHARRVQRRHQGCRSDDPGDIEHASDIDHPTRLITPAVMVTDAEVTVTAPPVLMVTAAPAEGLIAAPAWTIAPPTCVELNPATQHAALPTRCCRGHHLWLTAYRQWFPTAYPTIRWYPSHHRRLARHAGPEYWVAPITLYRGRNRRRCPRSTSCRCQPQSCCGHRAPCWSGCH